MTHFGNNAQREAENNRTDLNYDWNDNLTPILQAAELARPTPHQSHYFVRGAIQTESGKIISGGNHEYSITRAIHCEETLVARLLEECGEKDPISILAFHEDESVGGTPCGNCRDVLIKYMAPDAIVVGGNASKKTAVSINFSDLLFNKFRRVENAQAPAIGAQRALEALEQAYELYPSIAGVTRAAYGAAFIDNQGFVIAAAGFRGDGAYHPRLPLDNAITALEFGERNRKRILRLSAVVLASHLALPDLPYLERQHLDEFDSRVRAFSGKEGTPREAMPVFLVHASSGTDILEAAQTNAEEWLPHRFSVSKWNLERELAQSINDLLHPCSERF